MAQLIRFAAACTAALLCQYAAAQEPAATRPVLKLYPIVPSDLPADPRGVAACEKLQASDTESVALQCRRLWAGIPAGHPLPRLIDVKRARERLAALPLPAPAPQQ